MLPRSYLASERVTSHKWQVLLLSLLVWKFFHRPVLLCSALICDMSQDNHRIIPELPGKTFHFEGLFVSNDVSLLIVLSDLYHCSQLVDMGFSISVANTCCKLAPVHPWSFRTLTIRYFRRDELLVAYFVLEYLLACSYAKIQSTSLKTGEVPCNLYTI